MKIQDIMTKNPSCVTADATVREAAQVMRREDVGIVPVVDGAVRQAPRRRRHRSRHRDSLRRRGQGRHVPRARRDERRQDSRPAPKSDDVDSLMEAMRTEKVRRIPIVDERGSLVGIVSQADVVRKARRRTAAPSEPSSRSRSRADVTRK